MNSLLLVIPVIVTSAGTIVYLTRIKPKRELRRVDVHNEMTGPITVELNGTPISARILPGKTTRLPDKVKAGPFHVVARNAVTAEILYSHDFDQREAREVDDGSTIRITVGPGKALPNRHRGGTLL